MLQKVLKFFAGGTDVPTPAPVDTRPVELASIRPPEVVQSVIEPVPIPQLGPRHDGNPVPYYPRRGPAVPAASPDKLIATQATLIRELRQASALSFDEFDQFIRPTIARYAAFVHLLPASEYDHHSDLGGLFRHGLEVALNACRRAEGKEFALNEDPCVRKFQIFRWRACALLGGMLHDLGKAVIDVGALDDTGRHVWNPHVQSLWDWLQEHEIEHYTIAWRHGRKHREHDAISATALVRIIPDETMRWMGEHRGRAAYDAMLMALTTEKDHTNPLNEIIKLADGDSVAADRIAAQRRQASIGEAGTRARAAMLVRAMRELILKGSWQINQAGGSLWYGAEGLYGVFPACLNEAVTHLQHEHKIVIPYEPAELSRLLTECGVISALTLPDGKTYVVHHLRVNATTPNGSTFEVPIKAIKFSNEHIIPDYFVLPPHAQMLLTDPDGRPLSHGQVKPYDEATQTLTLPDASTPAPVAESAAAAVEAVLAAASQQTAAPTAAAATATASKSEPRSRKRGGKAPANAGLSLALPEDTGAGDDYFSTTIDDDDIEATPLPDGDGDPAPAMSTAGTLRDRANERDLRDQLIIDHEKQHRDPFPPTSAEGARTWLQAQNHGIYLDHVIEGVRANELQWNTHVFDVDDAIYIAFPTAFDGCGNEPTIVRDEFHNAGWLEKDPVQPSRTTVPVPGRKDRVIALCFNHGVSRVLKLLLPPLPPPPKPVVDIGPYIRGRNAAYYKERADSYDLTAAIVRLGFHEYLTEQYRSTANGWTSATETHLQHAVHDFAKKHRKSFSVFLKYIKHGGNALLMPKPDLGTCPNPDYDAQRDQAMLDDVMKRVDPEGNPL